MKCLVVDPSPTMTRIIHNILRAAGAEDVLCARNADDAIGLLEKQKQPELDLVVTERDLGGKSGLELVAALRAREGLGETAAIVVSSRNSRRDVLEAIQAGVDAYVLKPLDQEALLSRAVAVLEAKAGRDAGTADGKAPAAHMPVEPPTGVEAIADPSVPSGDETAEPAAAEDTPSPDGEDEDRKAA